MFCRLCLADNHPPFQDGLRKVLEESPEHCIIGEANDYSKLLDLVKGSSPDLVIIDPFRQNFRGIADIHGIRAIRPEVKILVLTTYGEDAYISRSLAAGANGYLLKQHAYKELLPAIARVQKGEKYISPLLGRPGSAALRQKSTPGGERGGA